jgi:hypothetical protein
MQSYRDILAIFDTQPPGHNAWVIGNEPVVGIDFTGLKENTKS